jgi:hypothetical protein
MMELPIRHQQGVRAKPAAKVADPNWLVTNSELLVERFRE